MTEEEYEAMAQGYRCTNRMMVAEAFGYDDKSHSRLLRDPNEGKPKQIFDGLLLPSKKKSR